MRETSWNRLRRSSRALRGRSQMPALREAPQKLMRDSRPPSRQAVYLIYIAQDRGLLAMDYGGISFTLLDELYREHIYICAPVSLGVY